MTATMPAADATRPDSFWRRYSALRKRARAAGRRYLTWAEFDAMEAYIDKHGLSGPDALKFAFAAYVMRAREARAAGVPDFAFAYEERSSRVRGLLAERKKRQDRNFRVRVAMDGARSAADITAIARESVARKRDTWADRG
ncbi:MAG: hypothetical protein NVS2B17_29100 [Candidatus Velthaea sp.]